MPNYYLTENDRRLLDALLKESRVKDSRRPVEQTSISAAPDVYIAKATEAIDAITVVDGDLDQVDSGICDIYRINSDDELIQLYSDLERKVYNTTGSAIVSGQYLNIVRNKYGKWTPIVATGYDRISGQATAEVTGSNFSIDNVTIIKGQNPLTDPTDATETVSVINTMGWDIDDDGNVFAQWNQSLSGGDGAWEAYQAECPA